MISRQIVLYSSGRLQPKKLGLMFPIITTTVTAYYSSQLDTGLLYFSVPLWMQWLYLFISVAHCSLSIFIFLILLHLSHDWPFPKPFRYDSFCLSLFLIRLHFIALFTIVWSSILITRQVRVIRYSLANPDTDRV